MQVPNSVLKGNIGYAVLMGRLQVPESRPDRLPCNADAELLLSDRRRFCFGRVQQYTDNYDHGGIVRLAGSTRLDLYSLGNREYIDLLC